MEIDNIITEESPRLCRGLAPADVARLPYILPANEAPEVQRGTWAGLTSPILDLVLRPRLEPLGRWRGRAFAALLDPVGVAMLAGGVIERLRRTYLAVAAHELAHYVAESSTLTTDESPGLFEAAPTLFAEAMRGVHVTACKESIEVRNAREQRAHGGDFIRACCHLSWRSRHSFCGVDVLGFRPREIILHPESYGYRFDPEQYLAALGDEPQRNQDGSLRDVLLTDPPIEFQKLLAEERRLVDAA